MFDLIDHITNISSVSKSVISTTMFNVVCGLIDQAKELYEYYLRHYTADPFRKDTVKLGDALLDEISEPPRNKWQDYMIESTYLPITHSSGKARKAFSYLTNDYTTLSQQCRVTADQEAQQLLLKCKGNKDHFC